MSLRRTSSISSSAPAATRSAAAVKATWNPSSSAFACSSSPGRRPSCSSTLADLSAASVESTASPSAPPTCWAVLNSPEERPASSSATFVVAISVIGTKNRPMPIDCGITAGSTSLR
jgi:hypothetical protein